MNEPGCLAGFVVYRSGYVFIGSAASSAAAKAAAATSSSATTTTAAESTATGEYAWHSFLAASGEIIEIIGKGEHGITGERLVPAEGDPVEGDAFVYRGIFF